MASIYDDICNRSDEATKRVGESYSNRNDKSKFKPYFTGELPYELWKQNEGDHTIDILPWLAGPNYPKQKEGSLQHVLDIWVHTKIGYQKNNYVCLQTNYGQPCPICEKIERMTQQDGYDEDFVYAISPKRRCAYYILVWDSKSDERKGVQVWETPHYYSEKHIAAVARQARTGGMTNFAHPIDGKTIEFVQTKTQMGYEVSGFKLVERVFPNGEAYEIPRDIIESLEPLDNFIEILSYDEMSKITIGFAKPRSKGDRNDRSRRGGRSMGRRDGNTGGDDNRSRFTSSRNSADRSDNDRFNRPSNRSNGNRSGSSGGSVRRSVSSDNRGGGRSNGNANRGGGGGDQRQLQNSGGRSQLSSRRPRNARPNERGRGQSARSSVRDDRNNEQYVEDQNYNDQYQDGNYDDQDDGRDYNDTDRGYNDQGYDDRGHDDQGYDDQGYDDQGYDDSDIPF